MYILRNSRAIFVTLAATFAILSTTPAQANWSLWQGCCGTYYGSVEALYWKPIHEPTVVAFASTTMPETPPAQHDIDMTGRYDWGGRVLIGYEVCDWFFDVSYLYFRSKDHQEVASDGFTTIEPIFSGFPVGFFETNNPIRYQTIDARIGHSLWCGRWWDTFLYANARWVTLDSINQANALTTGDDSFTLDTMSQTSDFNGGGLGLGLGGNVCVWQGFGLTGSAGITLIYGESRAVDYTITTTTSSSPGVVKFNQPRPNTWTHAFPAFDLRFGIDYDFCVGCWNVTAELGYELDYYFDVLALSQNDSQQSTFTDVGFAGPYFKLATVF